MNAETLGDSNLLFTGPYQTSYFQPEFEKFQYCSNQIMKLQFDKRYFYGDEVLIDLYRNGDVVTALYLQLTFTTPGITVVDSLGTYAIEYVRLEYDTHVIETLYGEMMELENDLRVPQGKQGALGQLVGRNRTTMNSTYSIKLPFDCLKTGLPMCALKHNPVLRFKFRKAIEFAPSITTPLALSASLLVNYAFLPPTQREYIMSHKLDYLIRQTQLASTVVQSSNLVLANKTNTVNMTSNIAIGTSNSSYSFNFSVPYDYYSSQTSNVTLALRVTDTSPSLSNYTVLVNGSSATVSGSATASTATLVYSGSLTRGATTNVTVQWNTNVTITTAQFTFAGIYFTNECLPVNLFSNFVFPTTELFFVIQNTNASVYDYTLDGTYDQIASLRLAFNGNDIIPSTIGTPIFLRQLQGLENHTRSPDRFFYTYAFALDPENDDPSGSVNLGSITRQQISPALRYSTNDRFVRVYSRVYNYMTIEDGALRVAYEMKDADIRR